MPWTFALLAKPYGGVTEGPVWDGEALYFTHIPTSRWSPSGRVLETHPVPAARPTNCCFGGPDLSTLYVTSTQGHFFRAQTDRVGWAMYP